ncbi:MAG: hypothetical protein OHK0029_13890 [Armatimonadaceae bacterium]
MQDHLEERIEREMISGVAQPIAESEAIASFGDPRRLVHRFLHESYETPYSRRARKLALGIILVVTVFGIIYWYYQTIHGKQTDLAGGPFAIMISALWLICAIGAFLGRQARTIQYATYGIYMALFAGIVVGYDTIKIDNAKTNKLPSHVVPSPYNIKPLSRLSIPVLRQREELNLTVIQRDHAFLEEKLATLRHLPPARISDLAEWELVATSQVQQLNDAATHSRTLLGLYHAAEAWKFR